MDQSVLSYFVIYDMYQSILNCIFLKSIATGITTVATGVDNSYVVMGVDDIIMPVATFLFLSVPKPLNHNPFIFLPYNWRHPLLLCVRLHRAPSSASSMCASTSVPHSSSMLKRPGTMSSTRPLLSRLGTSVGTTLLLLHWVHASPTSSTCSSLVNPLPLSFPLPP
jgi:hypothetical protein